MNYYKIFSGITLLISLLLLALPRIFPVCTGLSAGNPMRCHYAYQAEFLVTLLAVILAVGLWMLRTAEARFLSGFVLTLLAIVIIVIPQPWAVGICSHGGACEKATFFTVIGGGVLALAGAGIAWLNYRRQQEEAQ